MSELPRPESSTPGSGKSADSPDSTTAETEPPTSTTTPDEPGTSGSAPSAGSPEELEPAESASSVPSADSPGSAEEEDSDEDQNSDEQTSSVPAEPKEPAALTEPPTRTGVAPIINVPSGPDKGLGGFFDTLDERAKIWWATRDERKARRKTKAEAARKQKEARAAAAPAAASQRVESPAQHTATPLGRTSSADLSLPKPPPPEQRPPGQLFTGAIPQVGADPSEDPLPESPGDTDALPEFPVRPEAGEDQTTVIPPYRDDPAAPEPAPGSEPAQDSRVRRELDAQRQRTVIAQKAAAIEKATSEHSPRPYGGAGTIGAGTAGTDYPLPAYEFADDEEDLYTYIPPYNLPSRDPGSAPTQWDLARRITVSLGAVCALLSSFWMLGWFGTSEERPAILRQNGLKEELASGMFSGEHALLSPDHTWYWIWPLITIGVVVHALYQWRPSQHSTPRQQRSGWLVAAASIFMLVMTYALYSGRFTIALFSSLVIAAALTEAIRQFNLYTARSNTERQLTDDIVGLFYGFALVQLMSALSVWLTNRGWELLGLPALFWAGIGLFLAVWTASFYAMTERGRITIAMGLAWGLFWLIFPRILGEVTSTTVALGAALGAFIVIICTQSRRHRINHAERRAAMGRPLEDII
ncbi:hypothetical protein [Nesterenkonia ebinurensis]|uniref:hypothetical protein n=1 Tax=Nesterenkonia ebinurensis TaxID=2608252 RepID=UPI00123DF064|nr:hypothetical protein [Nesterenkonia ebinurensis]